MKRCIRALAVCFAAIATMLAGTVSAAAAGSVFLENITIPAEGRLFMPGSQATRGTVVIALYNVSGAKSPRAAPAPLIYDDGMQDGETPTETVADWRRGFSDVPKGSPYYDAVTFCASWEYISGYPDETFRPEGFITRAEMCEILCRFRALEWGIQTALPDDVPPGHWAAGSISAVIKSGIMSGYTDGTFKPENSLTRAELATIIVNAEKLPEPRHIREFNDVSRKHWAYKYIACVSAPPMPEPSTNEVEAVRLVNAARAKAGAGALEIDTRLSEVAQAKAREMAENNIFGHKSPKWGMPDEMADAFGVAHLALGENIASGATSPADVVSLWAKSSPHYNNMVKKVYTKTGIGSATSDNGTVYWVQFYSA